MTDAGIDFEYERIPIEKWPGIKKDLMEGGARAPVLPYVVTKSGELYTRVAPLMRTISKSVGKYAPKDAHDEYLVDSYSDLTLDWRVKWVQRYFVDADTKEVEDAYVKELEWQYSTWNAILGDRNGPYVLGQEVRLYKLKRSLRSN